MVSKVEEAIKRNMQQQPQQQTQQQHHQKPPIQCNKGNSREAVPILKRMVSLLLFSF
ncbi:unnamed protein product [Lupinus luteus]|uniref:Uncharacterized protein n=1 Tax=Lupinus luteus TaxID=3873 RepID=A0AAV1WZG1_LUPLU